MKMVFTSCSWNLQLVLVTRSDGIDYEDAGSYIKGDYLKTSNGQTFEILYKVFRSILVILKNLLFTFYAKRDLTCHRQTDILKGNIQSFPRCKTDNDRNVYV